MSELSKANAQLRKMLAKARAHATELGAEAASLRLDLVTAQA